MSLRLGLLDQFLSQYLQPSLYLNLPSFVVRGADRERDVQGAPALFLLLLCCHATL